MSFRLKTVLGIACIEALPLIILAVSGLNDLSSSNAVRLQQRVADALKAPFVEDEAIERTSSDRRLEVSAPITVASSAFGRVELGLSTSTLVNTIDDALIWRRRADLATTR